LSEAFLKLKEYPLCIIDLKKATLIKKKERKMKISGKT